MNCSLKRRDVDFKLKELRLENENLKHSMTKKTQEVTQAKIEIAELNKKQSSKYEDMIKAKHEIEKINGALNEVV